MHNYFIHGLRIASEIELFEPAVDCVGDPDLTIALGAPRSVDIASNDRILEFARGEKIFYDAARAEGGWIARAPGIASFDVDDKSIVAHLERESEGADLLPLLIAGTGLAFYLMVRGEACLHASAIEVDGTCVAFAGSTGRGKTTMAALSCAAGYALFGDDLLRLGVGELIEAHRGSSEIRLRPAVIELADVIPGDRRTTVDARTSVRPRRSDETVLPLSAIVLPRPDRRRASVEARRLIGTDAFHALAECLRLVGWQSADALDTEFGHLITLSSRVPVVETFVPWQKKPSPELADAAIRLSLETAHE
jgi:hypothetical protein